MELVKYQRNFPDGVAVPRLLCALLEFQNSSRNWYSGHFELDTWEYGQPAWFDGDSEAAKKFAVLGHGSDGSLYALWLYTDRTLADAPVVFLGSEGTDCGLLAGDLSEFLALLAIGTAELGFAVSWGDIAEEESPAVRLAEFREWLQNSFDITPPEQPLAIVSTARTRHPDFAVWLASWQAARFG